MVCVCVIVGYMIGTITAHGADVWSYAEDEDCLVKVPRLGELLAHWGIDIMRLEKTDQTLAEQEVELNKSYNWSKVLESGADLQVVSAPGCIGLANIGSSCYMNAILQILWSIPEVRRGKGGGRARDHLPITSLCVCLSLSLCVCIYIVSTQIFSPCW